MNLHQSKLYFEDIDRALSHIVGVEKLFGRSIIITGVTGTIGSFVADALIRLNEKSGAGIQIYLAGRDVARLHKQFENCDDINLLQYDMNSSI